VEPHRSGSVVAPGVRLRSEWHVDEPRVSQMLFLAGGSPAPQPNSVLRVKVRMTPQLVPLLIHPLYLYILSNNASSAVAAAATI